MLPQIIVVGIFVHNHYVIIQNTPEVIPSAEVRTRLRVSDRLHLVPQARATSQLLKQPVVEKLSLPSNLRRVYQRHDLTNLANKVPEIGHLITS